MEDKKYTAMDIANYIIWYVNNEQNGLQNYSLTPLKLQKILYYVSTEYFKKFGKRLFIEDFQKWQYGPVVKDVYHEFKSSGVRHIANPKVMLDISPNGVISRKGFDASILLADENFIKIADKVIDYYKSWGAFDLVERTHEEFAWKKYESDIMKGVEHTYSDSDFEMAKSMDDK